MRLLFHAPNRRGLGHVMRAATVIRAIAARDTAAHCLLAVSHALPPDLLPDSVRWTALAAAPDAGESARAPRGQIPIAGFGADLIVFDTVIPSYWREFKAVAERRSGARLALLLREVRPAVLAELHMHPLLGALAGIVVPHRREEFDPHLPGVVHVGPIARICDGEPQAPGIDILSTAGGGGHRELCEAFFATVVAADHELRARGLARRHLLVTGPRFAGRLPETGPIEVRRFEPRLPALIAAARVVVSRAGYNTVAEILAAGAPAILVPGDPGLDDQRGRAERLAATGCVDLVTPGDIAGLTTALVRHLTRPAGDTATPAAAVDHAGGTGFSSGAALAAAHFLSLAAQGAGTSEAVHV